MKSSELTVLLGIIIFSLCAFFADPNGLHRPGMGASHRPGIGETRAHDSKAGTQMEMALFATGKNF